MPPAVDRERIEWRVRDWIERLNKLYESVKLLLQDRQDRDELKVLKGSTLQRPESLMTQFEVPPEMLPTLAVLKGTNRVSFVPSALWIIGANGRVNVTTNLHQFILVDLGGVDGAPSDWRIQTSRGSTDLRVFDSTVLEELIEGQTIR